MPAIGSVRHRIGLLVASLVSLTACSSGPVYVETLSFTSPVPPAPASKAAVTASPTGLLLHGQPWWPAGFNVPELATNYSVNFGCGAEIDLDHYFTTMPEHSLTRFSLFQALAINKTTGKLDFSEADAVFAAAERHGRMILPVLDTQSGDCASEIFKQRQWYVDGWTTLTPVPGRVIMSFQDWLHTAVDRWRTSPALAGWEIIGEPEPSICADEHCELHARTCPDDAAQVLRTFMDNAGTIVRNLDPHRLIFAGYLGGPQCGTTGEDFAYVSASPEIDVVEFHQYSEAQTAVPTDEHSGLAQRLGQARGLAKPLLIAEIGERAGSCVSLTQRRDHLAQRMIAQRHAGTAGALIWAFVPDPREGECTYDVGPRDPLWDVIAEQSTLG